MRRFLLAVWLLAAAAGAAHARAGGGDNYSGGSSGGSWSSGSSSWGSGSSSYSGSGGDGGALFDLVFIAFRRYPLQTSVLVLACFLFFYFSHHLEAGAGRPLAAGLPVLLGPAPGAPDAAAELRKRDPGFDREAFLKRVERAFLGVQAAWSAEDLRPVRGFLSDAVYERFGLLLKLNRRQGLVNRLARVRVLGSALLRADADPAFDTVHVRVAASCVDRYHSTESGEVARGSDEPGEFVEVWSFMRSSHARTKAGPALLEGNCPSCGQALTLNQSAKCASCQAWVNSGEFDWVLAEITQPSVWSAEGYRARVSLEELRRKDPAFHVQAVEDLASVLFWRYQQCLAEASEAPLAGRCLPGALKSVQGELGKAWYRDPAVGGVLLEKISLGDDWDCLGITVRWSGRRSPFGGNGGEPGAGPRECRMLLTRRHGALTPSKAGLRSNHCAGCGAAAPEAGGRCGYCERLFNDPESDWVLARIEPA